MGAFLIAVGVIGAVAVLVIAGWIWVSLKATNRDT
jgi:hypothetical protein